MRKEFSRGASILTVLPILALSLIFLGRLVMAFFAKDNSVVANLSSGGFNAVFYLSVLICAVAFNNTAAGLAISRLIAEIHRLSIEDSLTKISNRRHIETLIETELEHSRRERKTFSIVMLDVDCFKSVNDRFGHAAGDAALQLCASVIKRAVRGSDYVGRVGGEEFCALLPETDQKGALLTAERMRSLLERENLNWEGTNIPLTASFGVVTYTCDDSTSSDLFKRADSALYRAKNEGRNRVITAMAS